MSTVSGAIQSAAQGNAEAKGFLDYMKKSMHIDPASSTAPVSESPKSPNIESHLSKRTPIKDGDIEMKLKKLKQLYEKHLITKAEYDKKREELLGRM